MEAKKFKDFNRELSWSTRIYTLATVIVAVGSFVFNAWDSNFALTIIMAIAVILFVESFVISIHRHPKFWRTFRVIILLVFLTLLLIGFQT